MNLLLRNKFNVALINTCTELEGPYKRMAIWFQGCDIGCKNCCNPELQEIKVAHIMTLTEIVNIALKSRKDNDIEGITLLGGEPTLQKNLHLLTEEIQRHDLGIILFTGRLYSKLDKRLVRSVDLIIDGQYIDSAKDESRNLIGSSNQRIFLESDRYKNDIDWFTKKRDLLVDINVKGELIITGDYV